MVAVAFVTQYTTRRQAGLPAATSLTLPRPRVAQRPSRDKLQLT